MDAKYRCPVLDEPLVPVDVVATCARLLGRRGREVEVAVMDTATPVWLRLAIDARTGRVVRERMVTGGQFMRSRHFAFNKAFSIEAPDHG